MFQDYIIKQMSKFVTKYKERCASFVVNNSLTYDNNNNYIHPAHNWQK